MINLQLFIKNKLLEDMRLLLVKWGQLIKIIQKQELLGVDIVEGYRQFQFSAFIWDNGYWDNSKTCDYIFGHFQRSQLTWENSNFISALIKAVQKPLGDDPLIKFILLSQEVLIIKI